MLSNSLKINLKALFCASILAGSTGLAPAQSLQDYVQEGMKSNLVLQQKNISLQQAQQSLKAAKSYFLPTVNVLADYTSGDGGRSIAIPIGDLLNPVYSSLNQMTQSDAFPQVENVEQNFFPKDFYDARVRTSIPLINTDLLVNRTIQSQQVMLRHFEVEAYKRQLVLDIKTAYYNKLSAESAVKIYESALTIVKRNVQVNESLFRNGKTLPANLLRSESELERVQAELNNARNQVKNASQYFNFLLNRDLDAEINSIALDEFSLAVDSASLEISGREELHMIKTLQEINSSSLQMNKLSRLPKVNAFLDLGAQASNWSYNSDARYYLVGVQLSFPIFQGSRNVIAMRQNKLEIQKTDHHLEYTTKQLALAASLSKNQLQTTIQNFHAAEKQLKSAQSYFNLIEKGYKEGVNALIEFLDARNQFTSSELQLNLRKLEVLIAGAQLERETASYSFTN